jgi:hypothetical protein
MAAPKAEALEFSADGLKKEMIKVLNDLLEHGVKRSGFESKAERVDEFCKVSEGPEGVSSSGC